MAKAKSPKKSNETKEISGAPVAEAPVVAAAPNPVPETNFAPTKTVRRPPNGRSELMASIVPINVDEEIRRQAYLLSERRGFAPGHEAEDWLTAEHEVRERYHHLSAPHSA